MEIDRNNQYFVFDSIDRDAMSWPGDRFPASMPFRSAEHVLSRACMRLNEVRGADLTGIPQGALKAHKTAELFRHTGALSKIIDGVSPVVMPEVSLGAEDFLRSQPEA